MHHERKCSSRMLQAAIRLSSAHLPAVLGCVLLLAGLALQAQTAGQQVSPQPLGGNQSAPSGAGSVGGAESVSGAAGAYAGVFSGERQQQSVPLNLPGTGPLNTGQTGQFGTGVDIPQTSPNAEVTSGDLLDVVVFDTPDLSGRFRVNAKGDILLPLSGNLHVAGMTVEEITDAVTKRYKDDQILVNPQVTVFVAEFTHRTVTLTGEVRLPGVYPILAPRTLTDVLALAGGVNESASRTVSIVHADDPKNIIQVTLNVGAQTVESIEQGRIKILPGDQIFVARSGIVYMVGDLIRPGGYQVEHNNRLTLLEAVALAGGPSRTAKLTATRLIRRSATGREELTINLQKVLYGGGPDVLLTDGDILYVPISLRKQYEFQALDAAISAATSYAIFKISSL